MSFETDYPGLNYVLEELFEAAGDAKLALKDGDISPDELVSAIPDEAVREYVRRWLAALKQLPTEMQKIISGGPWEMMKLLPVLADKGNSLFK